MSSAEVAAAVPKAPKEKKAKAAKEPKEKKPKAASTHPTFLAMIKKAVTELKERNGSSRAAILKYITANYKLEGTAPKINARLRSALIKGVEKDELKQTKGTGAAGSFKLADKTSASEPKKVVKKPKTAEKKASPAKKTKASPKKKTTAAKKEAKPKSPKKAAKSPKKAAAAKPKAPKAKKTAAKATKA